MKNVLKRIEKLREYLKLTNCGAFVVMNDEDSNWESLYYLSGFRGTCGALVVYPDNEELILDGRYFEQGSAQSPLKTVQMNEGVAQDVRESLKKHGTKSVLCEAEHTSYSLWKAAMPENTIWTAADDFIMSLRRTKDEEEIRCIKKAAEIGAKAFLNTLDNVREGMKEKEFEALLNYNISMLGGETGFDMIVASGVRSSMPHGRATDKEIKRGEIVTVDYGARVSGYFCDITRNFTIGSADERVKELHTILYEVHNGCAAALKAGIPGWEVHELAVKMLGVHELDKYFTHGLGHGFGLSIHEYGLLSKRQKFMLQAGDTLTVEPGVYIEGWGGLRLEDDYLVTENGAERLTTGIEQKLFEA